MFGLGKPRSKFGKFVEKNGISHGELVRISGVSKDTVTKACAKSDIQLRGISKTALVKAVNKITSQKMNIDDFW